MASSILTDFEKEAIDAFCRRMEGTPHMQRRCIPGRGVDCVQFTAGALMAAQIVEPFRWPQYKQNVGIGSPHNHLSDIFMGCLHAVMIDPEDWEPETGDIGIFKVGTSTNHVGIQNGELFWHVTTQRPVRGDRLEIVRPLLESVIRITGRGLKSKPAKRIR